MKLAVMQPYFFPYLGYFDLLNQVDEWIVYDVAQYIRHGWVNRNRVLHPNSGWWYIIAPLKKHHFTTPINHLEISSEIDWQPRIIRQLQHYRRDAPCYAPVMDFLESCLASSERNLARFNVELFRKTSQYLGIDKPISVFSEINLPVKPHTSPQDLALQICRAMHADEYVNPPGGAGLYDAVQFKQQGIRLTIQSFSNMPYTCGKFRYEPTLSIIDVMMWNSPEQIKHYLDTFRSEEQP